MDALEEEILRLRTEKDRLNEVAANWKRCAVALLGAEQTVYESIQSTLNFEPGVFIWMVPSPSENVAPDMGRQQQQITEPQSQQLLSINSYAEHLSLLGFHSKSAFALLQNCKSEIRLFCDWLQRLYGVSSLQEHCSYITSGRDL